MKNNRFLSGAMYWALLYMACWTDKLHALFGKTELELNGIGVIKESAEILAKTANTLAATFPTYKMTIALIGLIAFAKGLSFLVHGIIDIICGSLYRATIDNSGRLRGLASFLLGMCLALIGTCATLFSSEIVIYLLSI